MLQFLESDGNQMEYMHSNETMSIFGSPLHFPQREAEMLSFVTGRGEGSDDQRYVTLCIIRSFMSFEHGVRKKFRILYERAFSGFF